MQLTSEANSTSKVGVNFQLQQWLFISLSRLRKGQGSTCWSCNADILFWTADYFQASTCTMSDMMSVGDHQAGEDDCLYMGKRGRADLILAVQDFFSTACPLVSLHSADPQ